MAEWTSPAFEFHQKHIGTTSLSAIPAVTPDLISRWQPLLTGVEDSRRDELVAILEFETGLVAEIMCRADLVETFRCFMKTERSDWVGANGNGLSDGQEHVLAFYHQAVKRRVLERPTPAESKPDQTTDDLVALRLAHRAEIEAMRRAGDALKSELNAEREKSDHRHGQWLRAVADFDNYQKRVKRDQERDREAALRRILGDLASVADNATLVIENALKPGATIETVSVAISTGVRNELMATMARHGARAMGVKPGDKFDPVRHEAVAVTEEDGAPEPDSVASVIREGYTIGAAILRAASVVVKRVKAPKPVVQELTSGPVNEPPALEQADHPAEASPPVGS